ncbi:MFS transporter [Candidatus Falkowbacteria bacterium]|nr:MFS transporter [Candidatus Falkowbacteria bacterium]
MKTKNIDRSYLTVNFLMELAPAFFYATYQLFLLSKGLDYLQINLINACFMASRFAMEIPTGVFADLLGRKRSVQLGLAALSLSFFAYYLAETFWYFILAEVIGAFGGTCVSGAFKAWFVDERKLAGGNGDNVKVFAVGGQFKYLAMIFGSGVGAQFGARNLAYPWLLSAGFMALALAVATVLMKERRELQKTGKAISFKPIAKIARDSVDYGLRHRGVMQLVYLSAIMAFVAMPFNMMWPVTFKGFGMSVNQLGLAMAAISGCLWFGAWLAPHFNRSIRQEFHALVFSQILTACSMLIASLMLGGLTTFIFFLAHEVGRGMFEPLNDALLNQQIENDSCRATILSFESMLANSGAVLGLICSGYVAKYLGIGSAWLMAAVVLAAGFTLVFSRRNGSFREGRQPT